MLENSIRWRRDYRPDELDPDYIKPEVCMGLCVCVCLWSLETIFTFAHDFFRKKVFISNDDILNRSKLVKCTSMALISAVDLFG